MKCDELTLYHSKSLNLPIYVASEVDADIAELKAENERLKAIRKVHVEAIASMEAGLQQDGKEICHQKYKRCVAMVKYCHEGAMWLEEYGVTKYAMFMFKWEKRWLEIAEKFKEAK